jgi:hypothetical protein
MSKFCTSCGTSNDGSTFCTGCGAATGVASAAASVGFAQEAPFETEPRLSPDSLVPEVAQESMATKKSKKKIFVLVGVVLAFVGTSVGAYFIGMNSIDLENEKKISYDSGVSDGKRIGDSDGFSRGLRQGKESGCREVFSFSDGVFDYLIPYNPNSYYDKYPGGYYVSRSNC